MRSYLIRVYESFVLFLGVLWKFYIYQIAQFATRPTVLRVYNNDSTLRVFSYAGYVKIRIYAVLPYKLKMVIREYLNLE